MGRRAAAALIALVAWTGLAVQFSAIHGRTGSAAAALWGMLRYFTITTNLAAALLFAAIAAGFAVPPRLLAGLALAMGLVGIVYQLLLRGLLDLSGGDALADLLLHWVTPVAVPLFWLAAGRKGALAARDPLLWTLYPAAYLAYALGRGLSDGLYPYPFMDIGRLGWARTGANILALGTGFLAAGYALVRLDARLAGTAR
ncbi:Pr6Pr family membrane protein [Methylobacterium trifolii]|uniref:Pr6Pr family membrane protein n=1 Tax=Methylobacterium trifolii TaxID=1003092 RepID=A0ABQ4TYY7_9HYPH|nr:Pr6Pr family membrane protein [Methylobacterium trifolii]GJE59257.1 hypothetical protein MPOCJGCO_1345 [Methylobacterium trifolii]